MAGMIARHPKELVPSSGRGRGSPAPHDHNQKIKIVESLLSGMFEFFELLMRSSPERLSLLRLL
jgi:hypothetical protein